MGPKICKHIVVECGHLYIFIICGDREKKKKTRTLSAVCGKQTMMNDCFKADNICIIN